jgi:hypothetical protein
MITWKNQTSIPEMVKIYLDLVNKGTGDFYED